MKSTHAFAALRPDVLITAGGELCRSGPATSQRTPVVVRRVLARQIRSRLARYCHGMVVS
ncbi:MAG: hypothetical protein ABIG44_13545 [Planctomycetota bacterium]